MLILSLTLLTLHVAAQEPKPGTVAPQIEMCLHDNTETPAQKARREEALAAMRMIDYAVRKTPVTRPSRMTWERLAGAPVVRELKAMEGRVGDLARTLAWGEREPLPGWRVAWLQASPTLQAPRSVLFSLTDTRDPCAFKYRSDDPDVIPPGAGGVRLLPLNIDE
jgi:hypothetical protein